MRDSERNTGRTGTRSSAEGETQEPEKVVDPSAARRPEEPGTAALGSEGGAGSQADKRPPIRKENA